MYQSRCMTKNSWWWAERLPETCRFVMPIKLKFSASVGFTHKEGVVILISFMRATGSSRLILLIFITLKIFCRISIVALLITTQHSLPAITSINSLTHLLEKHQARIQPDGWCHMDWKFMSLQKKIFLTITMWYCQFQDSNCRQNSAKVTACILLIWSHISFNDANSTS